MKVITYNKETEPAAEIECDCGHKFWVDPCGEENLITVPDTKISYRLVEQCPNCKKDNKDGKLEYPKL